jgi:asparagine synthase (glutamine-hydrolysing)
MFAAIAGEAGCRSEEIAAMATALPGRGELLSRADPAHALWVDASGAFAAASRMIPLLPEDPLDAPPAVDRELIFVCRARLDDRAGLLQLLQIEPALGATLSDAQVLRHCYKKWREATPQHVYGDFAFVAWERWSRRTVAATDHLGNFPLFYCRTGDRVLLASQLSALLACPSVRAELDPESLGRVAAGRPVHGRTMFAGIEVLQGGHLLVHHEDVLRVEKWWRPDTAARDLHAHTRDYIEEARILFDSAVASRLRARGGVVATLSGGLDSALVAVTAAGRMSASGKVLEAFTASEQEDGAWATQVAEFQPNIRQRLVSTGNMTPLDILPLAHKLGHTPVSNPASLVWTWQMSAGAAHNRARVILCAAHGNQSIGYAGDLCDAHFVNLRRLAGAAQHTWDRVRCLGVSPRGMLATAFATKMDQSVSISPSAERELFTRAMLSPRTSTRVDFMARFGVEWLDPTADRKLLERLLTFPLHIFRVGNRPRGLARELGHGRLPESVRLRRTRAAHFVDQTAWFTQRAADYRRAWQSVRDSAVCAQFMDLPSLGGMLETLCAGNGTPAEAAILHRALDAGLFAAALESGQGIEPGARTGSNHKAAAAHAHNVAPTPSLFESVADMRRISSAR